MSERADAEWRPPSDARVEACDPQHAAAMARLRELFAILAATRARREGKR